MRLLRSVAVTVALVATPSLAAPNSSQHPRIGELARLTFAVDSADVPIGSEPKLGEIAAWAKANVEGHVVVEGYADSSGPSDQNVTLSLHRADAVRRQLVVLGVDPDQVIVAGYGESRASGRRVIVWGSRASVSAIESLIHARGAKTVQESPLLVRR